MRYEVEHEFKELKCKLELQEMHNDKANNFIVEDEYEDDYSGNEISDMQSEFLDVAREYLKENYSGQYFIQQSTWCVHIVTSMFYKGRKLKYWKAC